MIAALPGEGSILYVDEHTTDKSHVTMVCTGRVAGSCESCTHTGGSASMLTAAPSVTTACNSCQTAASQGPGSA